MGSWEVPELYCRGLYRTSFYFVARCSYLQSNKIFMFSASGGFMRRSVVVALCYFMLLCEACFSETVG